MNGAKLNKAVQRGLRSTPASGREVARRADLSQGYVSKVARGEVPVSLDGALAIAKALEDFAAEATAAAQRLRADIAKAVAR